MWANLKNTTRFEFSSPRFRSFTLGDFKIRVLFFGRNRKITIFAENVLKALAVGLYLYIIIWLTTYPGPGGGSKTIF